MIKKALAAAVMAGAAAFAATAADVTGTWTGRLNVTKQKSLNLVFHIGDGTVSLDSPDQSAFGIKGTVDYQSADSISFSVARIGMKYAGHLENDTTLSGKFSQWPLSKRLSMIRSEEKMNRPQTPQAPFPYSTEDLTIETPDAMLAGTLTVPEGVTTATPVAVLVTGSGLQNRDEELFGHRPFAVIADYLARNGIATFRYDDRGYGASKGRTDSVTTEDFAADAEAVANNIRRMRRFSAVGLIGHSEGGMIGYMLGAKPGVLDFVVSIAGPAVSGAEINAYQNKVALLASGADTLTAENFSSALLRANKYRLEHGPLESVDTATLSTFYPEYKASPEAQQLAETIKATLTLERINPWMEYFLRYDPATDLRAMHVPAFIIYGEKDTQVPPSLNLVPARDAAPAAQIKCYPGLNHPMQHATTGAVSEYREIEETISPEVLADIAAFIRSLQ